VRPPRTRLREAKEWAEKKWEGVFQSQNEKRKKRDEEQWFGAGEEDGSGDLEKEIEELKKRKRKCVR
jgi:hypothetical protein